MSERTDDQLARLQTLDILSAKSGQGGFGPKELKALKDAMVGHVNSGGDLNHSMSFVNSSLSTFAPSIRLTLSLELPKQVSRPDDV